MNGNVLDMSLETEEFITAEEYMKRRKAGAIDPARVRYAVNPPNGQIGGFYVKLERPRYRVAIPSVKRNGINKITAKGPSRPHSHHSIVNPL